MTCAQKGFRAGVLSSCSCSVLIQINMMLNNEFSGPAAILHTNQHDMYIVGCQQGLCLVRHEHLLTKKQNKNKLSYHNNKKCFDSSGSCHRTMERTGSLTCRYFLVGLRLAYSLLSTVMAVLGEETQTRTLSVTVAPTRKSERLNQVEFIVQELCESRGGRPGLSVLTSLVVSVDVKNY